MSTILAINIVPDSDTIDLYDDLYSGGNETYLLRGYVDLHLSQPVHICQIKVSFKGHVNNAVSINRSGKSSELTASKVQLINQKQFLLSESILPRAGHTRLPFVITIQRALCLPPSVAIPNHSIEYELSARISLGSLKDKVRLSCWNPCMSTFRFPHKRNDSSTFVYKRPRLFVRRPIRVNKHTYGSLECLDYCCPHTRYHGLREGRIRYEISMSKFACLQSKRFDIHCSLRPLCDAARVAKVEILIEQIEKHPIRSSIFATSRQVASELTWMTRLQKTCQTLYSVDNYESTDHMPFTVNLDSSRLGQDIESENFKMTHNLRIIVHFMSPQERKMSLRFPIRVGTIPLASDTDEARGFNVNESSVLSEIMPPNERLPSYLDALLEGQPPCPFTDPEPLIDTVVYW